MPTRKQRRRREKDFRHEMRVFEVDAEGNELPLAALRTPEERKPKQKQQAAATKGKSGRALRVPPKPTWKRSFQRGGLMGVGIIFLFAFVVKNGSPVGRFVIPVLYAVAFVPLTYWIDRTAYRAYEKRAARAQSR